MILRSSAAPHICLSCRRALVSRNSPWKSIWTSYSTAQLAPNTSEAPRNHAKKFPNQYPLRNEDGNIDQEWRKKELAFLEKSKPAKKKQAFRNERGESFKMDSKERESLYRKPGHKKRHDFESLSMPILGQDGKVLVLRDSVVSNYYATSNRTLSKPAAHIDIIDQMDEERGLPGESEVLKNIEVLKPISGQEIHTWDEVSELVGKLQHGFTTSQLRKYIDTHQAKIEQEKGKSVVSLDRDRKKGTIATPWRPGISGLMDYFDNDPLRGYVLDSYSGKQRTILQLLIECWGVEALEISEGIGQFEIEVCKPKDLDLLLAGPISALDNLYTERLNLASEKMEVFRSRNAVRVTTAATKRDWVLEGFNEIVARLRREEIQLEAYGPVAKDKKRKALMSWVERTFDERTLKKVADIIRVDLTWSRKRNILEVAAIERIESGKPDYRWDAVRRLLMMPSTIMDRTKHRIAIDVPFGNRFVPYTLLDGLNWWARLRKWTRCTAPISKDSAETPRGPKSKEPFLGKVLQARSPDHEPSTVYRDPAEALPRSPYIAAVKLNERRAAINAHINGPWARSHFTKTTATFGAVLHGYHPKHPINHGGFDLLQANALPADSHEFSTHVPNVSRFISHTSPISPDERPGKKMVLRFRPDPFTKSVKKTIGGAALHDLPTIEMHFSIGPKAKKTLMDVYAIVGEERTDVMLPQNAVDVRFTQKTTSRWKKGLGDNMLSQFDQYIKKCDLDGKRMEIYPTIQIPITPELCVGKGLGILQRKQSKLRRDNFKDPRKTRLVPYLFANLEVRQKVVMKFQGWTVIHTSVEAGKTGGRRDELTLTPMKGAHMASEEDFVAMAYNIADVLSDNKPDIRTRAVKILKKNMSPLRIRRMVSENEDDAAQASMYFSTSLAMQDAQENEDERLSDESEVEGENGSMENEGESLSDDLGAGGEKALTEIESGAPVPAGSAEDGSGNEGVPPEDQRDHGEKSHNSSGGYYLDRD